VVTVEERIREVSETRDLLLSEAITEHQVLPRPNSSHPGGTPGANLKSISHTCHPNLMAFVWELTKETIDLPLGCLQGGVAYRPLLDSAQ